MPDVSSSSRQLIRAALLGSLLFIAPAMAQQEGGRGDRQRPQQRAERPERPERAERPARQSAPATDEQSAAQQAEVEAWVRTLVRGIGHANPVIQRSAAQAIIAVGPPAAAVLREVESGRNEELAARATRILAQIERSERPDRNDAEVPVGRVLADMDLTAEQREQVQRMLREHQAKAREIMQSQREAGAEPADMRQGRQRLRAELIDQLKDVLTPEQVRQVAQALDRGMGGGRPDANRERPAPAGERPGAGSERPGTDRERPGAGSETGRTRQRPNRADRDRP